MRTLLILFLFSISASYAQRGTIHYSKENGLASNEINGLAYDKQGFLWLATNNGIDRFDGQRFIHFKHNSVDPNSILGNRINSIVFDGKSAIYASVENKGLVKINTSTFAIQNYTSKSKNLRLSGNKITTFCKDKSNVIWIAQQQFGLDKFERNKVKNFKPSSTIPHLNPSKSNTFSVVFQDHFSEELLWCLSDIGLFQFNKSTEKWSYFPINSNSVVSDVEINKNDEKLRSVIQDGKGNLYLGTAAGSFLYFDLIQKKYKIHRDDNSNVPLKSISGLAWRDSRYVYTCVENDEFLLFDTRTKNFIRFDDDEKINIQPFHLSRNGAEVAICSKSRGLFIQNENQIYGNRASFPGVKKSITNKSQTTALLWKEDNTIELRVFNQLLQTTPSVAIESTVLAVTDWNFNDFLILDKNYFYQLSNKGQLNKTNTPFEADEECLISSTMDGFYLFSDSKALFLFSLKSNKWKHFKFTSHESLKTWSSKGKVNQIAEIKQRLYFFGTEGIHYLDLKTNEFKALTTINNVINDEISTALFHDNVLWLGTISSGLFAIDLKSNKIVHRLGEETEFPLETILSIVSDKFNRLWILNKEFVVQLHSNRKQFDLLGESNGLDQVRSIICSGNSIFFIQENAIVGGSLIRSIPIIYDPKPYIQRVLVLNNAEAALNLKSFDASENSMQFEFGVLDFGAIGNNNVYYRLKGLDETWRPGDNRDEVSYYNLPGGNYEFELKVVAGNREFVTNYEFVVYSPFYKTWWFIVLTVLLTVFSIWLYVRVRIKRIETTERMKAQFSADLNEMESKALQAQMNPHFLFNSLNSIRLFILKNDVDSAANYIAKFSKLLRMILNYSRQDMITVYDEIQAMKLYLDFEKLRFDNGFDFDIDIDGQDVLDFQIPPLIVQPFIENAIWHGLMARNDGKGELHIAFKIEQNGLRVKVEDNGVGRERSRVNNTTRSLKEGSVGLQITKERLKGLSFRTGKKNELEIIDLYDDDKQPKGTLVNLYFEL